MNLKQSVQSLYNKASGWLSRQTPEYALDANGNIFQLKDGKLDGNKRSGNVLSHDLKSLFQTRLDIKDWKEAEELYYSEEPKTYRLQLTIADIMKDALLTSQVENRMQRVFTRSMRLVKPNGELDEEQTKKLKNMPLYRFLTRKAHEKLFYEYSVVELGTAQTVDGRIYYTAKNVPRTNIVPQTGLFYPDYTDDTRKTAYRDMPEYGIWILEFWNREMPLLNKAVPHVLFKRFAQSCHSELCEIYGIPPRVLKTNTQDKKMMARAQKMMKDMGAASWFIIDEEESFEFAQAATTTGEVYTNLMNVCANEMCLLIVGAILGQDTKNGNRAKDEVANDLLDLLVQSDCEMIAEDWNNIILPALKKHGLITGDVTLEYPPIENIQLMFDRLIKLLEYYDIEPTWFEEKLGIKILGKREQPQPAKSKEKEKLKADLLGDDDFFGKARQRLSA